MQHKSFTYFKTSELHFSTSYSRKGKRVNPLTETDLSSGMYTSSPQPLRF